MLFGVSRLLFQPALGAEITGIGLSAASAAAAGGRFAGSPDTTNAGPPGAEKIDVRSLVRLRDKILIELIAQARNRSSNSA